MFHDDPLTIATEGFLLEDPMFMALNGFYGSEEESAEEIIVEEPLRPNHLRRRGSSSVKRSNRTVSVSAAFMKKDAQLDEHFRVFSSSTQQLVDDLAPDIHVNAKRLVEDVGKLSEILVSASLLSTSKRLKSQS